MVSEINPCANEAAMLEESPFDRRTILKAAVSTSVAVVCSPFTATRVIGQPAWSKGDPFALGVAAGAPAPDGFVLWTRLAPDPLAADPAAPGGMRGGPVDVIYEIATDADMRNVVRQGVATAEPDFAYSVHLEVGGLQSARPYWYRFRNGDAVSRIGRAITTPEPRRGIDGLHFGFVSCSNYETGYFSAYRHLADENPDLVLFLGDYISTRICTDAVVPCGNTATVWRQQPCPPIATATPNTVSIPICSDFMLKCRR
jgi:alkaline phosphatase D